MNQQFEEGTTLDRFLMDTLREAPGATGTFVNLMQSIALAGKMISSRVNRAGLAGMYGGTGDQNVQGEFVQKLDVYANEVFKKSLEHRGHTAMIVSEEDDGGVRVPEAFHSGRYIVTVDPLDGSSNIDVNATIGTIFGIFRRLTPEGTPAEPRDALRKGSEMVAAGYITYGAGTVLVIASDAGVHGFQLDPTIGEFFLTHPNLVVADGGKIYSCNTGYWDAFQPGVRDVISTWRSQGYSSRYIGSLVADFHRNLIKGGVFLYPATASNPQGKLRLLYEAFPLAYIIEKAGGSATDGRQRILDITATELHARTPLVIGTKTEVALATERMSADPSFEG